jgi:uncharacterized protein (UPF0262 family)
MANTYYLTWSAIEHIAKKFKKSKHDNTNVQSFVCALKEHRVASDDYYVIVEEEYWAMKNKRIKGSK